MIKLYGGAESLSMVFTGSSASVDYYMNYTDINKNIVVDSGVGQGNLASAQLVVLTPGPATNSYTRQVNYISVINNDGANTATIDIRKSNISTTVNLATTTLQPGWKLAYQNDVGWQVFNENGIPEPILITLTGDVTGSGENTIATTLATVNANVGTFGDNANVPQITVNGKGLITNVTDIPISATAGGSDTDVQYNSSGAFAGSGDLTFVPGVSGTSAAILTIGSLTPQGGNLVLGTTGSNGGQIQCFGNDLYISAEDGSYIATAVYNVEFSATDQVRFEGHQANFFISSNIELDCGTTIDLTAPQGLSLSGSFGTSGQVLTTQGSGSHPIWQTNTGVPGGNNGDIQFNASGTFLGSDFFNINTVTSIVGTDVTAQIVGNLVINGVTIGSSSDNTPPAWHSASSAYSIALAINAASIPGLTCTTTNVQEIPFATVVGSGTDATYSLTINGYAFYTSYVPYTSGSITGASLAAYINTQTSTTNVSATYSSPNMYLTNANGGDITITQNYVGAPVPPVGGFSPYGTDSLTYRGNITLSSDSTITIAGGSDLASAGLTAGTYSPTTINTTTLNTNVFDLTVNQLNLNGNVGTSGQVLTSQGNSSPPEWTNPAPVYTLSTLPTATPGFMITVSDANGGNGALCYCIASTWLDARTNAVVA